MAAIARIAWLPALQMMGGLASNFVFVRLAGDFGESVQAAFAISLRIGMIVPIICFPLAGACATLVGQALGAGDVPRAWRAVGIGILAHGAIMWSFAAGVVLFRHELVALLSDDPEVMRHGAEFLLYSGLSFFFFGAYFVVLRSLQGAGDFTVPMALTLANAFLVTIPLAWWLTLGLGRGGLGIAQAQLAGAAFVTLSSGAWLLTGRWTGRGAQSPPR
jgi:Na+-driven multidrug efflux pump